MDPAAPNFVGFNEYVIVDKTDALFVDTIHTSAKDLFAGGAGMFTATGHVDFYVNGGRTQPGCHDGISAIFNGGNMRNPLLRNLNCMSNDVLLLHPNRNCPLLLLAVKCWRNFL
jgi:hypothetical protein